jgi:hypothetical protein
MTSQSLTPLFFFPQGYFQRTRKYYKQDRRNPSTQKWTYKSKSADFFLLFLFLDSELFFYRVGTLANNFSILLGTIDVTVPRVADGDDYQIVCEYDTVCSELVEPILNNLY